MAVRQNAARAALTTVALLFGSILVGIGLGHVVFSAIPGHSMTDPAPLHAVIAAIPMFFVLIAGGAMWGIKMGRIAGSDNRRRMALAGVLGFLPITLLVAFGLLVLEPIALEASRLPIHRLFTLLFVPSAFLIAGISAWSIGRGLQDSRLAHSLLWKCGLAAAIAFLGVNVAMELLGWVVGAPGAAERATMIVVMSLGNLAAALAAGGLLGYLLRRYAKRTNDDDS